MSVVLLALAVGLLAVPADEVEGDRIRIVSELDAAEAASLSPGASVEWLVDVSTIPGEPGTIDISLSENGDLGLEIAAYRCKTAWQGSSCESGESILRELSALPQGEAALLTMTDTDSAHLRLVVVAPTYLPRSAEGSLRLMAHGVGDEKDSDGPHSPLQPTGSLPILALSFAALGALGAGIAITLARALRRLRAR